MPLILLFFTLPLDQSSTNDPTFSQVSLCCPSISLSLWSRRRSIDLKVRVHPRPGCRTLAGTVAGRQGVTVRGTHSRPPRAPGGPAPAPRPAESRHRHRSSLATLVTQGRGQWGSHWRRQRRRLWRLRPASPAAAGSPAPALLDIRLLASSECH